MTPEQATVLLALMNDQPDALLAAVSNSGIDDADAEQFISDMSDILAAVAAEDVDEDSMEMA